jgi:hypothetical protein
MIREFTIYWQARRLFDATNQSGEVSATSDVSEAAVSAGRRSAVSKCAIGKDCS